MAEGGTTGRILTWTWDNREEIRKRIAELFAWFRSKEASILVLGPGGTGKTTLGRILAGEFDWLLDPPGAYQESIGVERYALTSSPGIEIVVPPGQKHRRGATWKSALNDIGAGKFRGIVLVGAYGYHSLGEFSYKQHDLYQGDKRNFVKDLLEAKRAEEIQVLRQMAPHLRLISRKCWLLSLVAKQDLWWPNRQAVEAHYRQGEYGAEVQAILDAHHSQFRHESVFASLVISNFLTGIGERLRMNAAGYDQRLQVESLWRILETIDALKQWDAER